VKDDGVHHGPQVGWRRPPRLPARSDQRRPRDRRGGMLFSRGWGRTSRTWRQSFVSSSRQSTPWCARDPSPGLGMCPLPIHPTAEIV
jgi:hypothetical protein